MNRCIEQRAQEGQSLWTVHYFKDGKTIAYPCQEQPSQEALDEMDAKAAREFQETA